MKKLFKSLIILSYILVLSCGDESLSREEGNVDSHNEVVLAGTWSYIEHASNNQDVHYHITFKEDSTAVFCAFVLDSDISQQSITDHEWRKEGDIACYYDTIFYNYYVDGNNINLIKTGYKKYSNLPWKEQMFILTDSTYEDKLDLIPQPKYDKINSLWQIKLNYLNKDEIVLSTFHLLGVYRFSDYDDAVSAFQNGLISQESLLDKSVCPVARNSYGDVIYNSRGRAIQICWYYGDLNKYFIPKGGYPCIEDINYDGQINESDLKIIGTMKKLGYDSLNLQYVIDRESSPFN